MVTKMSVKSFIVAVLSLHVLAQGTRYYIEQYTSPVLDMSFPDNSLTSSSSTQTQEDCVLQCMVTSLCVAVNVGPVDEEGNRVCQLKSHLVTLQKWLQPAPGFSYFYVVPPTYNRTGCYKHSTRKNFDFLSNRYRLEYNDWKEDSFRQMIFGCGAMAWRRGYDVFGIEYGGECWATNKTVDYRADGIAPDINGTGGCFLDIGIGQRKISVFEF